MDRTFSCARFSFHVVKLSCLHHKSRQSTDNISRIAIVVINDDVVNFVNENFSLLSLEIFGHFFLLFLSFLDFLLEIFELFRFFLPPILLFWAAAPIGDKVL